MIPMPLNINLYEQSRKRNILISYKKTVCIVSVRNDESQRKKKKEALYVSENSFRLLNLIWSSMVGITFANIHQRPCPLRSWWMAFIFNSKSFSMTNDYIVRVGPFLRILWFCVLFDDIIIAGPNLFMRAGHTKLTKNS